MNNNNNNIIEIIKNRYNKDKFDEFTYLSSFNNTIVLLNNKTKSEYKIEFLSYETSTGIFPVIINDKPDYLEVYSSGKIVF